MKFPPSVLDEIKARLPVSAVVGKRVRLQKAGREWKGLSPFNAEKTASFFVNDQKASFFDFSSGKNGDIFKFVMETEGLSLSEAIETIAQRIVGRFRRSIRIVEESEQLRARDIEQRASGHMHLRGDAVTLQGGALVKLRADQIDRLVGVFALLDKPIDFDSLDGEPVDVMFLLLAPESAGADHLKALARKGRTARERDEAHGPDAADWLGVPMRSEGYVSGAVVVQSYDQP